MNPSPITVRVQDLAPVSIFPYDFKRYTTAHCKNHGIIGPRSRADIALFLDGDHRGNIFYKRFVNPALVPLIITESIPVACLALHKNRVVFFDLPQNFVVLSRPRADIGNGG